MNIRHFGRKNCLISLLITLSIQSFGQCENMIGDSTIRGNWKKSYVEYFRVDSNSQFIKADSVLISYFNNSDNETNYGMPCCYYLAEIFAQRELREKVKILNLYLEKEDLNNFTNTQKEWQKYYESEWEFLRNAFIAYSNLSKYGQGREIMIHNQSRRYNLIKDRILTIEDYIEIAKTDN